MSTSTTNEMNADAIGTAFEKLAYHLLPLPNLGLRENHFCSFTLVGEKLDIIFGRVNRLYPKNTSGEINNIELWVPQENRDPIQLSINSSHVGNYTKAFIFRVPAFCTVDEIELFYAQNENVAINGFEFQATSDPNEILSLVSLLKLKRGVPWIIVVSSKWLSELTPDLYSEVLATLQMLLSEDRIIIDFQSDINLRISLNRIFGFSPVHSQTYFYETYSTNELFKIIESCFYKFFSRPLYTISSLGFPEIPIEENIFRRREPVRPRLFAKPFSESEKQVKRKLRVFLCHSSGDKVFVEKLFSKLMEEKNIEPWLDKKKILPGETWDLEIKNAIRESGVVVVCLSEKATKKEGYVQKEIKFALDVADEKPEGTIFIIPIRLDECVVPNRLSQVQWLDYFDDTAYSMLLSSLKKRAHDLGVDLE